MQLSAYNAARARDAVARIAATLPHDARRSLFLRARPSQRVWFDTIRTNQLGEVPGMTISLTGFDRLRCIFVHVPRCAGVSVGRTLFGGFDGNHLPIATYQMIFSKADFESYFKFAFVRNPWDRLLSAYSFMTRDGECNPPSAEREVDQFPDFESFVMGWVTPENIRVHEHYRPQHRFVCSPDGKLCLDYVGRFETIEADMAAICERLGVDASLVHHDRPDGAPSSYRDHYTPEMRDIVAKLYAKDIELFGYSFDDGD